MIKRTVVDQIEIIRNGTIQIRMAKEIVDDDESVISKEWHRTALQPGGDIDLQMAIVNLNLERDIGYPAVPEEDIARIRNIVPIIHTEAVKASYAEKLAKNEKKIK